jgi:transposase
MNIHKNASLTPICREEMALAVVRCHLLPSVKSQAARLYGVSAKIVSRWVERFNTYGRAGMMDRSSRPAASPRQTAAADAAGLSRCDASV